MKKAYGRKTKKKVGELLAYACRTEAMEQLEQIPDPQLVGPLFSYFYHGDDCIKFRSISAMGLLVARMGQQNMEKARVVLRRIMWNLNDESGGIGWGSPEAMGEILCQSPALALEFESILFSYLDPDQNFIEHEMLQRGVLWGIGTYLKPFPEKMSKRTQDLLSRHLFSLDPVKRAYAIRALINSGFDCSRMPKDLAADLCRVDMFNGWDLVKTRISDMTLVCENHSLPVS